MASKLIAAVLISLGLYLGAGQASAQSCGGSISCCQQVDNDCECFVGGSPIEACNVSQSGDVCGQGNAGICSCTQWCAGGQNSVDVPCSGAGCTASCPGGYIQYAGSCAGGGGGGSSCPAESRNFLSAFASIWRRLKKDSVISTESFLYSSYTTYLCRLSRTA